MWLGHDGYASTTVQLDPFQVHQHKPPKPILSIQRMTDYEHSRQRVPKEKKYFFCKSKNLFVPLQIDNIQSHYVKRNPPLVGYLTISNALQWRLQYGRIVTLQEKVDGITPIIRYESK